MPMKILLVEDDKRIANLIHRGVKEAQYTLDIVYDGNEGLRTIEDKSYDLVILDVMLPGRDGLSICREIRQQRNNVPILMVTAKDSLENKIIGLEAGADDYLTKPFAFSELLARIRALLRRNGQKKTNTFKIADLELNQISRKVFRSNKEIILTSKEFALLEYLIVHANQVVTRTMVSEHVWKEDFNNFTNIIDVYIKYLRNKIDSGFRNKLIHTIRGVGYILKENKQIIQN